MVDHVKPTIRDDKPEYVHSEKTASQIVRSIPELAILLTDNDNSIIVSGIVPRHNVNEVNKRLVLICKERNITFISHSYKKH